MTERSEPRYDVPLTVNGARRSARVVARRTLSDFLRHDLGLTGTHVGCEHGVCGACTVLLDGAPVRSCLIFAVSVAGQQVTTVEGLGQPGEPGSEASLSPVQRAFRDLAEDGEMERQYKRWFLQRLPGGTSLDLPMSPQLETLIRAMAEKPE